MGNTFAVTATNYTVLGSQIGLSIACLLILVLFHMRRDKQPIRGRIWWQSELLGVLFLGLSFCLAFTSEFIALSCRQKFIASIMSCSVCVMINLRALHLFAAHQVAKDMTAGKYSEAKGGLVVHTGDLPASKGSRFSLKTLAMFQSARFQMIVWGSSIVFHFTIAMVFSELLPESCQNDYGLLAFIGLAYLYFAMFLAAALQVQVLKDELYLKKELLLETFFGSIILVVFVVLRFATPELIDDTLVLVYGMFPLFGVVILMPLVLTYSWESQKNRFWERYMNSSSDDSVSNFESDASKTEVGSKGRMSKQRKPVKVTMGTLEEGLPLYTIYKILETAEGQLAFTQFCVLRFAHENILFYNEAKRFFSEFPKNQKVTNLAEFSQEMRAIFDRYVAHGSVLEVNLPHEIYQLFINAGINDRNAEVDAKKGKQAMKAARDEIMRLMKYELYPRFIRHKLYRTFAMKTMMADANLNAI